MTEEVCSNNDDNYEAGIDELDALKSRLNEQDAIINELHGQLDQLRKTNQRLALALGVIDSTVQGLKL